MLWEMTGNSQACLCDLLGEGSPTICPPCLLAYRVRRKIPAWFPPLGKEMLMSTGMLSQEGQSHIYKAGRPLQRDLKEE